MKNSFGKIKNTVCTFEIATGKQNFRIFFLWRKWKRNILWLKLLKHECLSFFLSFLFGSSNIWIFSKKKICWKQYFPIVIVRIFPKKLKLYFHTKTLLVAEIWSNIFNQAKNTQIKKLCEISDLWELNFNDRPLTLHDV